MQRLKSKINLMIVLGLAGLLFLSSCVPKASKGGRRSQQESSTGAGGGSNSGGAPEDNAEAPNFDSALNFFQNGSSQTSSSFNLSLNFSNSFYLRGPEVNNYISNGNASAVRCIVGHFPSAFDAFNNPGRLLVLAATPSFFFNFSTNSKEHYYLVEPAKETTNQSFCLKAGLLNSLSLEFPGSTAGFSLSTLCPNCTSPSLSSAPNSVRVMTPDGIQVNNIDISYISYNLINDLQAPPPSANTCTSTSQCTGQGFDCCSEGQCVRDLQVKSGVNTSSIEFLQAQQDIASNPSNINNYPNFFHICSQQIPSTPTPEPTVDPQLEALQRFTELRELFECTNKVQGEMSLCTITFENASPVPPATTRSFLTGADDRTFATTYSGTLGLTGHSIDRIIHADEVLFEDGKTALSPTNGVFKPAINGNDNLSDSQEFEMSHVAGASAINDTLKIRYKIDGSCEQISTNLARCQKFYVQGQNLGRIDDHFPASNQFSLPLYADINRTIKVEVDANTRQQGVHWNLVQASPSFVDFIGSNLQVFDTQAVTITFFVDTSTNPVMVKKQESLERIKDICNCADTDCGLKEIKNNSDTVIDYSCVYPQPDVPPPPLQQTVLLSAKSVPHRYFDTTGAPQEQVDINTPEQEGTAFEYTNGDLLKPNNMDNHIGFNEIYGSFSFAPGSAKPSKIVAVEPGKTYDIFVDSGSFSSCFFCGTDYYSNIAQIFPKNFLHKGGGYLPDATATNRFTSSELRADDLIFGRACFVPATMIPWSHSPSADRQTQRKRRLAAQHFLFANGYQRDWYGFDYGSVIGSFDGVTWFAVGNQRRIQASSNKLFLAVNAYFGDLTAENSYSITVSDASTVPSSGSTVFSDFESEGAQCQKFHTCDTDSDCAAKLGWEYSCQSISAITSPWPTFDANASEIPGGQVQDRLVSIFKSQIGSNPKRCIYRGRGAPCVPNYQISNISNSYSGTDKLGLHACSANNYCQNFTQGAAVGKFNSKISRFGKSIKVQNASSVIPEDDLDTFGLAARIIGRPLEFIGSDPINSEAQSNFTNSNISALCIPGKNPAAGVSLLTQNGRTPSSQHFGDKVLGIGVTPVGNQSSEYVSSCSILGTDGNYFNLDPNNVSNAFGTSNPDLVKIASTQAIPTNSLNILETLTGTELLKNFEAEQITEPILQPNRCLRAPGSVCHTDLDCAPSRLIAEKTSTINTQDSSFFSTLNFYEIKFWQEELICSQETAKDDPEYDLGNNRCCREVGNTLSIGTLIDQSLFTANPPSGFGIAADSSLHNFDNFNIPGIGVALDSPQRYSRMAPVHAEMVDNPVTFPALETVRANHCNPDGLQDPNSPQFCTPRSTLFNQFNTFNEVATRTCCTKNWVRNFHPSNGGGHTWGASKTQNIPKESFRCRNWLPSSIAAPQFSCANAQDVDDPDCSAKATSIGEANVIFDWLNTLELLGIPQISIKSDDFAELDCNVDPGNHALSGAGLIIPDIVKPLIDFATNGSVAEYADNPALLFSPRYFSGDDMNNYANELKPIFSPDEISCCLPVGSTVEATDDPNLCCSGFINGQNNKCALPDFANVSVYFNAYVSSEANTLSDTLFDQETGFVKSTSIVESLACQKQACASGVLMRGVALSNLKVNGQENSEKLIKRFIDGNTEANNFSGLADLYDSGLRWNNDVYCVPQAIEDLVEDGSELALINCAAP